jgi:hypothetical protein
MPEDLSGDWRSLIGNDTGGGVRRGSWNSDADNLVRAKVMGRGDTGACSADVKGLGELNELGAGSVDTAEKHGHLETDARGPTALNRIQALAFAVYFDFQAPPGQYYRTSTIMHIRCQETRFWRAGVSSYRYSRLDREAKEREMTWFAKITLRATGLPQMCKWNAFTIDRRVGVWEYGEHQ